MATAIVSSSSIPKRPTHSCIRCADRKVKCDRQRPCSACIKHNVECVFNLSQPPRKRHRRVQDQILNDRLKKYETLLQAQGIDLNKLPDTPDSDPGFRSTQTAAVVHNESNLQTPSSIECEPSQYVNEAQTVQGQGRFQFVENTLWTRVVEESHGPDDVYEDDSNDASDLEAADDDLSFVLTSQPKFTSRPHHPPPERIDQLWQIFITNIEPVTKIVHVPTLRPAIQKATSNIESIPRNFEALMFAIYSAAIMSLKDDDCKEKFGEPRRILLSRYISASKVALSRAKFMATTSLVVLQALVIHLLSVRDIYEPRAVYSLTGVAVRIAQVMGMDRDGSFLGLPLFETEMRRRVWWQLKGHDFRTAELCGLAKFRDLDIGGESTQWATNVNDDQLYPGMSSLVAESNGVTDAVFIALRHELSKFAASRIAAMRQHGIRSNDWNLHKPGNDEPGMDESFREVEEIMETRYLRYCDPSQPLHFVTLLVGRFALNVIRFLSHHPRRWASIEQTPLPERQWVWGVSLKLLEQHNMMQVNPQLKQFAWHAPYFQQWHAFIHVLDTLRVDPLKADAEKAWQLVGNEYQNAPDMIFDTRKPIHVAVGNLCLKAYSDREAALQKGNVRLPPTPEYISQLRQQREAAKANRQARGAKARRRENPVSRTQANATHADARQDAGLAHLSNSLESASLEQNAASVPQPSLAQVGGTAEDDPYWFMNGFGDGQGGAFDDAMAMDLDFMLAQDDGGEALATQAISWEQWDAWLANSNVIGPLASAQDCTMST